MKTENLDRAAVLLTVIMFLIFLSTLSVSLDDEDSVHFALGLTDFNVTKYQPHPPGFPVYMGIGIALNTVLGNEVLTLTLISALFGALSVLVFYLLAREMFPRDMSLLASVLMAITPLFWLNSIKAMSDMAGLFFILLSMLFIYRYIKQNRSAYLYVGALMAGLSAGVRIHSLLILVPILIYSMFFHRNDSHTKLKGWLLFFVAILLWSVPLIAITGPAEYFSATGSQLLYRVERPDISMLGIDITPEYMGLRSLSFPYFFLLGGYGINLASLGILSAVLLLFMAALLILSVRRINPKDTRLVFFTSGVVVYLIAVFVTLPPLNSRYLLILVPILSLIFVRGICSFRKQLRYVLFAVLFALVLTHSLFLVNEIRSKPTPPVQLINHVNENYDEGDYIVLEGFMLKYFTYYGTQLGELTAGVGCSELEQLVSGGRSVLTISASEECDNLKLSKAAEFSRDPRVHVKRSKISLYEFLTEPGS